MDENNKHCSHNEPLLSSSLGAGGCDELECIFLQHCERLKNLADGWFGATLLLGMITIGTAFFWGKFFPLPDDLSTQHAFVAIAGKILVIALLMSATLWAARVHRILLHHRSVYKSREIQARAFKVMYNMASTNDEKNMIWQAGIDNLFSAKESGYLKRPARGIDPNEILRLAPLNRKS